MKASNTTPSKFTVWCKKNDMSKAEAIILAMCAAYFFAQIVRAIF